MTREEFGAPCDRAKQALAQGDPTTARDCYLQALALDSDDAASHYGLATACYLLQNWHEAAGHFEEVTRLEPRKASAYINLGAVYKQLDRLDEAVTAIKRGIQLEPTRAEGFHNLAAIYRKTGKRDLAFGAYLEALRLNPHMHDAHFYLAVIYQEKNDLSEAASHLRQALELRPDWEKAVIALRDVEEALQTGGTPAPVPEPIAATPPTQQPSLPFDPERLIDPDKQGETLQTTHKAAVDLHERGQEFVNVLNGELEPTILALFKRLLDRRATGNDLQTCISKMETALARMRLAEGAMRQSLERVQSFGEKLLTPPASS